MLTEGSPPVSVSAGDFAGGVGAASVKRIECWRIWSALMVLCVVNFVLYVVLYVVNLMVL